MAENDEFQIRMTDRREIVEFVREIERHPCIYNQSSSEHGNKAFTAKAWADIAKKCNTTVLDCKEKWRKIRIAFMRSLKQARGKNPPSRPYYLADHLRFILPFNKVKDEDDREPSPKPLSDDESNPLEIVTNEGSDISNFKNCHFDYTAKRQAKRKYERFDFTDNTPRKMFLMSIMPDIESFTDHEMRCFRRTVIDSIDSIINSREIKYNGMNV